jgi:hypothetical protein
MLQLGGVRRRARYPPDDDVCHRDAAEPPLRWTAEWSSPLTVEG